MTTSAKTLKISAKQLKIYQKRLHTDNYSQIPWSEIAKMRDVLTHHYFGVDDKVLWDTLDSDFEEFEKIMQEISNQLGNKTKLL